MKLLAVAGTLVTLVAVYAFAACAPQKPVAAPAEPEADAAPPVDAAPPPSLYDRLGGKDGVAGVIDAFAGNIKTDKRINRFFARTTGKKLEHFKQMLADQICEAADGGCTYTGKDMKAAHKGMGISESQYAAVVEDLSLALEEKQVGKEDIRLLLEKLGESKGDVVEKKGKKGPP